MLWLGDPEAAPGRAIRIGAQADRHAHDPARHRVDFEERAPWGLVLIICLPGCRSAQLAMHIAAGEASGNRLAVGLLDQESGELRDFVWGPVRRFDPSVTLLDSATTWRLTGAPRRIFILGRDRASYVTGDELEPIPSTSAAALERAYSQPLRSSMTWCAAPFRGDLGD